MAVALEIESVSRTMLPDWRISEVLNNRTVFSFTVPSLDGSYRPAGYDEVTLVDGATTRFAGNIEDLEESGFGDIGLDPIETDVDAIDFNALPDRRQVEVTLAAGTLKSMLTSLVEYLSGYGVTLDAGQVDGPTLDELVFELGPLTDILNKLSVITGYAWNIDFSKVLSMFVPGTTPAPFDIVANDGNVIGDISVAPSLSDYANRIIGMYAERARAAYAFFGIPSGTIAVADEVVFGSKTYTYVADVVADNVNGNVQIGVDNETSLINLERASKLSGTAGVEYAAAMTVNPAAAAYVRDSETLLVQALNEGDAGNSIAVSTTSDAVWTTEGGGVTAFLRFGADEAVENRVIADSGAAPADLVEKVIIMADVRDETTAQAIVDGYLVRSLVTPREIKYLTRTDGLHPGMSQHITASNRNLDADCLIMEVDTVAASASDILEWEVTAVEGLVIAPDHLELFKLWSGKGSGTTGIAVGSGGGTGTSAALQPFFMGGSRNDSVPMAASPISVPVMNWMKYKAPVSFTGRVRAEIWARTAGVTATLSLYSSVIGDFSDKAAVPPTSAGVTGVTPTEVTFEVPITAGLYYRAELLGDTASESVYGIVQLEKSE